MQANARYHGMDGESLQADVMRFMAIIAFCLIAILALVRNVEAPTTQALPAAEPPEKRNEREAPQITEALPKFVPTNPPAEAESLLEPEPLASIPDEPVALDDLITPTPNPASAPPTDQAQEGLILRFVSDSDFLRLIAKGDVQVYAFQDRHFLMLGEDYLFHDTSPPGKVYEVLRETIPALIDSALNKRTPDTQNFKWGIRLPERVEHQIQRHLNTVTTGQLLIDRYGKVNHVATR